MEIATHHYAGFKSFVPFFMLFVLMNHFKVEALFPWRDTLDLLEDVFCLHVV